MAQRFDVVILTTHGRGYRLARDLAFEGKKVAWLDISNAMGLGSKDWSGPFPAAVHPDATDLDRRQFLQDHDMEPLPTGLTVWHGDGVLETRGGLADFQTERLGQGPSMEFLRAYGKSDQLPHFPQHATSFKEAWFLYMTAFFNKSLSDMSPQALQAQKSLYPAFAPSYLPVSRFSARKKRQEELRVFGVQIQEPQSLQFRKELEHFYFSSDGGAICEADQFVSFLTAAELEALDPTFYRQVYSGEAPLPRWYWQRLRATMNLKVRAQEIPAWMLVMDHWDLPWHESNFYILKKTTSAEEWDIWVPVDVQQISRPEYREHLCQALARGLRKRLLSADLDVAVESTFVRPENRACLPFGLYKTSDKHPIVKSTGFIPCGADVLGSFDLYDGHRLQKQVYQKIHQQGVVSDGPTLHP